MSHSSTEDRLAALENSRHKIVGQMNAHRALLITAVATMVQRSSSLSPEQALAIFQQTWLPELPTATKSFPGIEASEFAAVHQEYEASIAGLLADIRATLGLSK